MTKLNLQNKLLLTIFLPLILLFFILSWVNYNNTYSQLLEQKRQATKNYIYIAEGIYTKYYNDFLAGKISEDEAKLRIHGELSEIRYGDDAKDYFWVNDIRPWMITHANKKLEGTDLSTFQDKVGQFIFKEFAKIAQEKPEGGFFTYMWPSKEDPALIVPKLSYVKLFKPWNHVIGTGIYIQDVKTEAISAMTKTMIIMLIIFAIILAFLFIFIKYNIINKLLSIIQSLQENSGNVTTSSRDIASLSADLSSATTEQAAALQETVAAINEIQSMVQKNAESAQRTLQLSDDSKADASEGKSTLNRMDAGIDSLKIASNELQKIMETNNRDIGEILKLISEIKEKTNVINDIASQTKLLSFNASVEAARAGEHGKGFAVVAMEVGNLAALSSKSANEIEKILSQSIHKVEDIIEQARHKVNTQSKESNAKLEQSVQITHDMVTIFNRIIQAVDQVNIAMKEVNSATQEQSQGISEINRAMMDFDQSTQMNNTTANKTSSMAGVLHQQSDDLEAIMEKLKTMVFG